MSFATVTEAIAEFAFNIGDEFSDHAWLLSDYDVWVRNPHYRGPAVPHPEADDDYDGVHAPTSSVAVLNRD